MKNSFSRIVYAYLLIYGANASADMSSLSTNMSSITPPAHQITVWSAHNALDHLLQKRVTAHCRLLLYAMEYPRGNKLPQGWVVVSEGEKSSLVGIVLTEEDPVPTLWNAARGTIIFLDIRPAEESREHYYLAVKNCDTVGKQGKKNVDTAPTKIAYGFPVPLLPTLFLIVNHQDSPR